MTKRVYGCRLYDPRSMHGPRLQISFMDDARLARGGGLEEVVSRYFEALA